MNRYLSWGRYPKVEQKVVVPHWLDQLPELLNGAQPFLGQGLGRSYGDVCLNDRGTLLRLSALKRLINFDPEEGLLTAESGFSLADIIEFAVPKGWFLPVSPGTKFVTLGGAIANDIHGKNHHCAGTFGVHVQSFRLLRSDGNLYDCSREKNSELFSATIGGLGLTGIILDCTVQLKRIHSALIDAEFLQFKGLDHFFELSKNSSQQFEYTVAWLDCVASGSNFGRGVFIRSNHAKSNRPIVLPKKLPALPIPFDFPEWALNRLSISAFNSLYFHKQIKPEVAKQVGFDPFFYPLDGALNWNRIYGKRGFFQFQCVLPHSNGEESIKLMLKRVVEYGNASFLAVLKEFGDLPSPGMLSFPRPGVTLCLDFPQAGGSSLKLLNELEVLVNKFGGAMYAAKDALMSPESFKSHYPRWQEFLQQRDPKFSSCFSRRIFGY